MAAVVVRTVKNWVKVAVWNMGVVIPERQVFIIAALAVSAVLDGFVGASVLAVGESPAAMFAQSLLVRP